MLDKQLEKMPALTVNQSELKEGRITKVSASTTDIRKALSLLTQIDPDLPQDQWILVAAALKRLGIDKNVFDSWSKGSKGKYREQSADSTWNGMAAPYAKPVNIATLYKIAR